MRFSTNQIKIAAYVLMIVDHSAAIWLPDSFWARMPGRLVFPVFCWLVLIGMDKSRDPICYFLDLLILAIVSQLPYMYAFGWAAPYNDIYGLAIGGAVVYASRRYHSFVIVVLGLAICYLAKISTGFLGILLVYLLSQLRLPVPEKGSLQVNKYVFYSIYPAHFVILGALRQITN